MDEEFGVMEFYYQSGANAPGVTVRLSPHSTIQDVLQGFESFLLAAGYRFNGEVVIAHYPQDAELN